MSDKDFFDGLKKEFLSSLEDNLLQCESLLMDYESTKDMAKLEKVMRLMHSLKGDSKALGLAQHSALFHQLETSLADQKNKPQTNVEDFVSHALKSLDRVKTLAT